MRAAFALFALFAPALTASAAAQVPVIGPGREADVLALLEPHSLGSEVAPGWVLDGVAIERRSIDVRLRSGEGEAHVVLHHPDVEETGAERSASFVLEGRGANDSADARAAVVDRVRANDDGSFWSDSVLVQEPIAGAREAPVRRSSPWPPVLAALLALGVIGAVFAAGRRGDA